MLAFASVPFTRIIVAGKGLLSAALNMTDQELADFAPSFGVEEHMAGAVQRAELAQ